MDSLGPDDQLWLKRLQAGLEAHSPLAQRTQQAYQAFMDAHEALRQLIQEHSQAPALTLEMHVAALRQLQITQAAGTHLTLVQAAFLLGDQA